MPKSITICKNTQHSKDNKNKFMFNNKPHFRTFWLCTVTLIFSACQEVSPTKTTINKETLTTSPIDSIDRFLPNPHLESYLQIPVLGKDFTIEIDYPKQEMRYPLKNNQFMFRVKGQIIANSNILPSNFKLRLFSNSIDDFKNHKVIEEWDIDFKNNTSPFEFKISNILNVQRGIYYFSIEQMDTQERFYVGKISLL